MPELLGDAPVEPQYIVQMNTIARAIDVMFNGDAKGKDRKNGFVLLVFPFDDMEGRCNFLSNGADRREIVILASLAVMVLALGLWPAPLLEVMGPTVDNLLEHISRSKLPLGSPG